MATIQDVLTKCEALAPMSKDFAALQGKVSAEFGAGHPVTKWVVHQHGAWQANPSKTQNRTAKMFASIGSKLTKPVPVASKPAPAITAEALGRAVLATATHPDPAISKPARAHLDGLVGLARVSAAIKLEMAAKEKNRPVIPPRDFSFLHGLELAQVAHEYERRGGSLSESTEKLVALRKSQSESKK